MGVHGAKVLDSLSDIETTASEADLDADGFDTGSSSSEEALACNPVGDLSEFAVEHVHWPKLPLNKASAHEVADEFRLSHREMALRYRDEWLEDMAKRERLRAKKAAAIRAAREAIAWKMSSSKRWQKRKAAKKMQILEGRTSADASQARIEVPTSLPMSTLADAHGFLNIDSELEAVKMARAAARHKKMYIKRSEFKRARSARDWTWGKAIEGTKPHHAARVALRARLAQGVVQSHEDMPSIVYMSKLDNRGPRRKPAIAHMILSTHATDITTMNKSAFDVDAVAEEVEASADSRQPAKPIRAPQVASQAPALADASASIPLPEDKRATRRMGCVVS